MAVIALTIFGAVEAVGSAPGGHMRVVESSRQASSYQPPPETLPAPLAYLPF